MLVCCCLARLGLLWVVWVACVGGFVVAWFVVCLWYVGYLAVVCVVLDWWFVRNCCCVCDLGCGGVVLVGVLVWLFVFACLGFAFAVVLLV